MATFGTHWTLRESRWAAKNDPKRSFRKASSTEGFDDALECSLVFIWLPLGIGGKCEFRVTVDNFFSNALRLFVISRELVVTAKN